MRDQVKSVLVTPHLFSLFYVNYLKAVFLWYKSTESCKAESEEELEDALLIQSSRGQSVSMNSHTAP
ncbi:hypothetical protein EVAR_91517_1 [Eumeta japonica]|uniref:Uncharacterized protein n=1 Tax=Eumeta variegata TaxID=151549 RepID=A0A4C1VB36_EUMVA|nr:hypothetical protein EVAR_91517_1 [Eumeta japonica]